MDNVVMTCNSVNPEVRKFPQRETKIGVEIVASDFTAILYSNGRAKVFCKSLEPPPHFSNCRIDNTDVKTAMRTVPEEELIERLREHGAADRAEKKPATSSTCAPPGRPR